MHEISAYVDDIYLQDDTKEKYIKNIVDTVALLRCLAFSLHTGKLQFLQIQQDLDILGFTINSINMTVSLTKEKKAQLSGLIRKTLNKKFIKNKKVWANNRENSSCVTRLDKSKQYSLHKSKCRAISRINY